MNLFGNKQTQKPGPSTSSSSAASSDVKEGSKISTCMHLFAVHTGKKRKDVQQGNSPLSIRQARRDHDRKKAESSPDGVKLQSDEPLLSSGMTSLFASLVSPTQEYEFRTVNSGTVTAGSGIWAGAPKFDPTVQAEWSSFSALFDEYKLIGAKITFAPYFNSSGSTELGQAGPYIICGANLGSFGTNPTSVANCMETANARMIYLSPGGPHSQYVVECRTPHLEYQTMGSGGTPYAGAYGQFSIYGSDFYSSSNMIAYVIELFVKLRARN
jgi:hypothetical protein